MGTLRKVKVGFDEDDDVDVCCAIADVGSFYDDDDVYSYGGQQW